MFFFIVIITNHIYNLISFIYLSHVIDFTELNSLFSLILFVQLIFFRCFFYYPLVNLFYYSFLIFFFVSISADPNRVPHDLPEAEPEPAAGLITEYSTIYSSLILLTEYANIMALTYSLILVFSIYPIPLVVLLSFSLRLIFFIPIII